MGSNTGFGNNGFFPNNFNQEQDVFSLPSFNAGDQGQQYFPPQQNMMGFGDSGEDFTNNNFQPQVGLFNGGSFAQNQLSSPLNHFSQPPPHIPRPASASPYPQQQLNSAAAQLKARLLESRKQTNSATPPATIPGQANQQIIAAEGSSSLRGSPQTPITTANVDDLISQYSSSNKNLIREQNPKKEMNNIGANISGFQRPLATPSLPAKSQTHSLGSPTKVPKPISNAVAVKSSGLRKHVSNGSLSEASEGEIVEDPGPQKPLAAMVPKQTPVTTNMANGDGQLPHRTRQEPTSKTSNRRSSRDESPPPRLSTNSKPQVPRPRDDRRDDAEPPPERRTYQSDQNERRSYSTSERQPHPRRESRDHIEEHRKIDTKPDKKREERSFRDENPPNPTLVQVLPHDEDLREWLEITGYHNHPYRNKILNRRRELAKLEAQATELHAQKNALLAEMEAEERRGPSSTAAMLPPPIPGNTLTQVGATSKTETNRSETPRDRVISNKRSYSSLQDESEAGNASKILRTDDRGERGPRIKHEDHDEHRRPISSGYDSSNRISGDRRTDRDGSRSYGEGRGQFRASSRERVVSPGPRARENRLARTRGYDSDSDDQDDRGERDTRPYQVRGGYRGRAYDPNFRGRGRGNSSRGDYQSELRSDFGVSTSFGSRIANGKPYKDSKGFSRGGKGETRYFIVKSFNEDNVLKCIDDSIWTTQVQNGPIFKEAFETCKNVILVFSINKSKAFQGYARMESLPGSVEVPSWQRAINWESAGAFKVKWLVICSTRFNHVGHLKNSLNENLAVLVGKDGQEIEEKCAEGLIELIDDEVDQAVKHWQIWDE